MTQEDIDALTAICKGEHGLTEKAQTKPLAKEHVPERRGAAQAVSLESIFHHKGVNALAEKLTGPNLIACPMCGRLEIDMLPMVAEVEKALKKIKRPINVSVMGCVVNGPGEGQHADIGIAGGKNKGILFKHGKIVGTFPEKELVPALLRELEVNLNDRITEAQERAGVLIEELGEEFGVDAGGGDE